MASSSISTPLCAVSFLLVLSICATTATNPKVKLHIYYGSMASNSATFLANQFPGLFSTGIIDIVELNLIPSEGTFIHNNSIVTCQNGEEECLLSMQELCAMHFWVDPKIWNACQLFGELCPEWYLPKSELLHWRSDGKPDRFVCGEWSGTATVTRMKKDKNIYAPPPNYRPWVLVNGRALREAAPAFLRYICAAYTGPLPKGCSNL